MKGICKDCYGELNFVWKLFRYLKLNIDFIKIEEMELVENFKEKLLMGDMLFNFVLNKDILLKD